MWKGWPSKVWHQSSAMISQMEKIQSACKVSVHNADAGMIECTQRYHTASPCTAVSHGATTCQPLLCTCQV